MKRVLSLCAAVFLAGSLHADGDFAYSRDFRDFKASNPVQDAMKQEMIADVTGEVAKMIADVEKANGETIRRIREEYEGKLARMAGRISDLEKQIALFKEVVVEANYKRNTGDDRLRRIEERLKTLEGEQKPAESGEMMEKGSGPREVEVKL